MLGRLREVRRGGRRHARRVRAEAIPCDKEGRSSGARAKSGQSVWRVDVDEGSVIVRLDFADMLRVFGEDATAADVAPEIQQIRKIAACEKYRVAASALMYGDADCVRRICFESGCHPVDQERG